MLFHMAEYCDTLQSKEKRNWENKACLNERTILCLLDHDVPWSWWCFSAPEEGGFSKNSDALQFEERVPFLQLMGRWDWFRIFLQICALPSTKTNGAYT